MIVEESAASRIEVKEIDNNDRNQKVLGKSY